MTGKEMLPQTYQHLSIAGSVRAAMSRNPDKQALKHGENQRSYRQLIDRADRISNVFIHDHWLSVLDHE
jgi:non-ribosomal peptide synthetase component F